MAKKTDTKDLPAVIDSKDIAFLDEMEAVPATGNGFEDTDQESYAIPFLSILQSMSPQLNSDDPAYIKEAKAGMVLNTVTGELFAGDEGVLVVPCHYQRAVIQWGDRDSGGGFIEKHPANTALMKKTVRNDKGQDVLPDGTYLVDTRQHYCLARSKDGMWYPVIVAMASTQNKKSRKWMTQMSQLMVPGKKGAFNPPMFGQMYHMKTIGESNNKGSWKGWSIEYMGLINDVRIFKHGQAFHEKVATGDVREAHDSVAPAENSETEKF